MEHPAETPFADPALMDRLATEPRLYLFLDYDGTLAEFSPTPDTVLPDPELIRLIETLKGSPGVRIAIVSGRRLEHILKLIPVPGLALAGTYGLEVRSPAGEIQVRQGLELFERFLAQLKPRWQSLLETRAGFYLEDKVWSLAVHARFASQEDTMVVFTNARRIAMEMGIPEGMQFQGGDRFLEISPESANKGLAVETIMTRFPWEGALPVYLGDDDKDELAFEMVNQLGGVSLRVSPIDEPTRAAYRLRTPAETRSWLAELIERRR
jgi:trehalose 6-phosphate phosphatase